MVSFCAETDRKKKHFISVIPIVKWHKLFIVAFGCFETRNCVRN